GLDETIAEYAKGWTVDRIAPLDLNVMRVALFEIEEGTVPVEVAIDEAVEIAKEYCGADAPKFINGILGAIVREREPAQ
ncbi:MAG: transcription antitermination protein NusB, partial [Solirubrobacterales bacterium]|nr:transcription antitermination protein NusB [Solirubrobacterales bacterium]